jgi:hypothetical protein
VERIVSSLTANTELSKAEINYDDEIHPYGIENGKPQSLVAVNAAFSSRVYAMHNLHV